MYNFVVFSQVLLKTTAGDIDIELWSKEAPKACRNFVQLCMEGKNSLGSAETTGEQRQIQFALN